MKSSLNYILIAVLVLCFNCGRTERVDTKSVRQALKEREIKKISNADIVEAGMKRGNEDSRSIIECYNKKKDVKINYWNCLDSNRVKAINSLEILIQDKSINLNSEIERSLFEAYQYSFTQKEKLYSNLQDLKNGQLLFTQPFYVSNGIFIDKMDPSDSLAESFGVFFIYYHKKNIIVEP